MEFNDAFFQELGRSPRVTDLCRQKAEEIRAAAVASAPVETGAYRDSIHVEIQTRRRRNAAVVVASDAKSMLIESRSGNLVRALNAVKRG